MTTEHNVKTDPHTSKVKMWWENARNMRWDNFYDAGDTNSFRMLARQDLVLGYLQSLNLPQGAKVLELGYGAGQTAYRIASMDYHYEGIDISQQLANCSIKRCQKFVDEGKAKFHVGSIEAEFPFPNEYFDAVVVVGALQYLKDQDKCCRETRRVLKPGHHFIVCQTNMYGLKNMSAPRAFILRILYALLGEEYELFPFSFKSMLVNTKLGKIFKKYENSKWMNSRIMLKGHEEKNFDIDKRLNSYWRLKKLLRQTLFSIIKADGAPFYWSNSGNHNGLCLRINNLFQNISDRHIVPFLFAYADNIILLAKKELNQ